MCENVVHGVMPEIRVSDSLYRQLVSVSEAEDGDLDKAMWKMVARYGRGNHPGD